MRGWSDGSGRTGAALTALLLALVVILLFIPSLDDGAPEMDEGTLVAYPTLVQNGMVPGRDFETFYGPGQPYALAAAGEIFGMSLTLERISGVLMRVLIALAVMAIVMPVGRIWAALGGVASAFVLLGLGTQGLAILGGIAALLIGLALLLRPGTPTRSRVWVVPVGAGIAGAVALSFRPDLAPALLLSAAPLLLWRFPGAALGRRARIYVTALAAGLIPLLAWALIVGPDGLQRLFDDLTASRAGRRLPLPGATSPELHLIAATFVVGAGALATAYLQLRRDRYDLSGRSNLAIALLLAGLAPSMLQRADSAHVLPVAAVAIGLSPFVAGGLLRERSDLPAKLGRLSSAALALAGVIVLVAFGHIAEASIRSEDNWANASATEVSVGDRSFRIRDPEAAADLQELLPEIERVTSPGDTIFTGNADLTRTVYADTFLYYLFPDLKPASFYTELNPGTSNAEDSSLPDELAGADVLVLTDRYEPDTATADEAGSAKAQEVVDERFCVRARSGSYELLVQCDDQ